MRRSLLSAFFDAVRTQGKTRSIVTDGDGKQYSYADISRALFALSVPIKRLTQNDETIGILLPTGIGSVISLLSVQALSLIHI